MLSKPFPAPVVILSSPESYTPLVSAMLGQHPQAYGFPELNLFLDESVEDMLLRCSGNQQFQLHGLLRAIAELYAGEQTLLAVDMARRWLVRRLDRSTAEVFVELCEKIHPLRAIDMSPAYARKRQTLERIGVAFPDAFFLHLTRHPRAQGESILNVAGGLLAVFANSIDYETDPPTVDPQIAWYRTQTTILQFLDRVPRARQFHLRVEDLLAAPDVFLTKICGWLGLDDGAAAIGTMLHPENSPFACLGPFGAQFGSDPNFLRSPAFHPGGVASPALAGPLPWRRDGSGFRDEVLALARRLGYA